MLVDTHVVLWLALYPERISPRASIAIRQARELEADIFLSAISLYEIATVVTRKKVQLDVPLDDFLERTTALFRVKPLENRVAIAAAGFAPPFPGDPFDRIIAATALTEGIPLVTADERIRRSGIVETIW
jgi:PIN domain nuclease of toxin-antitoxin system